MKFSLYGAKAFDYHFYRTDGNKEYQDGYSSEKKS